MPKLRKSKKDDAGWAPPSVSGSAPAPAPAAAEPPTEPQPAASYDPPPYTPAPRRSQSKGGLMAFFDVGETTAAERERVAAAEWEQVFAPVMDLMKASVPEANTPEEAARILAQNQGEITPDPKGGSYIHGDAFDRDARVYYRLLRRDYEKVPRPSEVKKRPTSHHLHQVYGKLVGTKGW
ncbi:MAG TPA: hypothetical protein VL337_13865 [Acidimicrobiales bacterium]|jgi:hypothetical protein|nr:hypothetical protein [Acidimicrobiales bacterium]